MGAASAARSLASERLELLDWKRRVFDLHREVRADSDPENAWHRWRDVRGDLIAHHPQSPVDVSRRAAFSPVYFDYDPSLRVLAEVDSVESSDANVPMSRAEGARFARFGDARFELAGRASRLALYWLEGYGGGVFLSFADATSGDETYGAGRYLLDTVKGADLGTQEGRLVLDFNFAFNPSCAYDSRWACPLAPAENRLPFAVRAGELVPRCEWRGPDLNRRHHGFQPCALPAELPRRGDSV
jgi:uncharacterized protein